VTPEEKSPQPASGVAKQTAAAARTARLPRLRSRPGLESASHLTRPILGPAAGCGGRNATPGQAASACKLTALPPAVPQPRKALWPVSAWPMTRVCISGVPS
jgi:hypothetical protein